MSLPNLKAAYWASAIGAVMSMSNIPGCTVTLPPVPLTLSSLHTLQGGVQVVMSQLPNLEAAWWASAIGAVMSM
jgi:hypothetical protein